MKSRRRDKARVRSLWSTYAPAEWFSPESLAADFESKAQQLSTAYSIRELRQMAYQAGIDSHLSKLGLARCIAADKNLFIPAEAGNYENDTLQYFVRSFGLGSSTKATSASMRALLLSAWKGGGQEIMNISLQHVIELHEIVRGIEERFCSTRVRKLLTSPGEDGQPSYSDFVEAQLTGVLDLYQRWVSEKDTASKRKLFSKTQSAYESAESAVTQYLDMIRKHCKSLKFFKCEADDMPIQVSQWMKLSNWEDRVVLCNVTVRGKIVDFAEGDQLLPGYIIGIAVRVKTDDGEDVVWLGIGRPEGGADHYAMHSEPGVDAIRRPESSAQDDQSVRRFRPPDYQRPYEPVNIGDLLNTPEEGRAQPIYQQYEVSTRPGSYEVSTQPGVSSAQQETSEPTMGSTFREKTLEIVKEIGSLGMSAFGQVALNILLAGMYPGNVRFQFSEESQASSAVALNTEPPQPESYHNPSAEEGRGMPVPPQSDWFRVFERALPNGSAVVPFVEFDTVRGRLRPEIRETNGAVPFIHFVADAQNGVCTVEPASTALTVYQDVPKAIFVPVTAIAVLEPLFGSMRDDASVYKTLEMMGRARNLQVSTYVNANQLLNMLRQRTSAAAKQLEKEVEQRAVVVTGPEENNGMVDVELKRKSGGLVVPSQILRSLNTHLRQIQARSRTTEAHRSARRFATDLGAALSLTTSDAVKSTIPALDISLTTAAAALISSLGSVDMTESARATIATEVQSVVASTRGGSGARFLPTRAVSVTANEQEVFDLLSSIPRDFLDATKGAQGAFEGRALPDGVSQSLNDLAVFSAFAEAVRDRQGRMFTSQDRRMLWVDLATAFSQMQKVEAFQDFFTRFNQWIITLTRWQIDHPSSSFQVSDEPVPISLVQLTGSEDDLIGAQVRAAAASSKGLVALGSNVIRWYELQTALQTPLQRESTRRFRGQLEAILADVSHKTPGGSILRTAPPGASILRTVLQPSFAALQPPQGYATDLTTQLMAGLSAIYANQERFTTASIDVGASDSAGLLPLPVVRGVNRPSDVARVLGDLGRMPLSEADLTAAVEKFALPAVQQGIQFAQQQAQIRTPTVSEEYEALMWYPDYPALASYFNTETSSSAALAWVERAKRVNHRRLSSAPPPAEKPEMPLSVVAGFPVVQVRTSVETPQRPQPVPSLVAIDDGTRLVRAPSPGSSVRVTTYRIGSAFSSDTLAHLQQASKTLAWVNSRFQTAGLADELLRGIDLLQVTLPTDGSSVTGVMVLPDVQHLDKQMRRFFDDFAGKLPDAPMRSAATDVRIVSVLGEVASKLGNPLASTPATGPVVVVSSSWRAVLSRFQANSDAMSRYDPTQIREPDVRAVAEVMVAVDKANAENIKNPQLTVSTSPVRFVLPDVSGVITWVSTWPTLTANSWNQLMFTATATINAIQTSVQVASSALTAVAEVATGVTLAGAEASLTVWRRLGAAEFVDWCYAQLKNEANLKLTQLTNNIAISMDTAYRWLTYSLLPHMSDRAWATLTEDVWQPMVFGVQQLPALVGLLQRAVVFSLSTGYTSGAVAIESLCAVTEAAIAATGSALQRGWGVLLESARRFPDLVKQLEEARRDAERNLVALRDAVVDVRGGLVKRFKRHVSDLLKNRRVRHALEDVPRAKQPVTVTEFVMDAAARSLQQPVREEAFIRTNRIQAALESHGIQVGTALGTLPVSSAGATESPLPALVGEPVEERVVVRDTRARQAAENRMVRRQARTERASAALKALRVRFVRSIRLLAPTKPLVPLPDPYTPYHQSAPVYSVEQPAANFLSLFFQQTCPDLKVGHRELSPAKSIANSLQMVAEYMLSIDSMQPRSMIPLFNALGGDLDLAISIAHALFPVLRRYYSLTWVDDLGTFAFDRTTAPLYTPRDSESVSVTTNTLLPSVERVGIIPPADWSADDASSTLARMLQRGAYPDVDVCVVGTTVDNGTVRALTLIREPAVPVSGRSLWEGAASSSLAPIASMQAEAVISTAFQGLSIVRWATASALTRDHWAHIVARTAAAALMTNTPDHVTATGLLLVNESLEERLAPQDVNALVTAVYAAGPDSIASESFLAPFRITPSSKAVAHWQRQSGRLDLLSSLKLYEDNNLFGASLLARFRDWVALKFPMRLNDLDALLQDRLRTNMDRTLIVLTAARWLASPEDVREDSSSLSLQAGLGNTYMRPIVFSSHADFLAHLRVETQNAFGVPVTLASIQGSDETKYWLRKLTWRGLLALAVLHRSSIQHPIEPSIGNELLAAATSTALVVASGGSLTPLQPINDPSWQRVLKYLADLDAQLPSSLIELAFTVPTDPASVNGRALVRAVSSMDAGTPNSGVVRTIQSIQEYVRRNPPTFAATDMAATTQKVAELVRTNFMPTSSRFWSIRPDVAVTTNPFAATTPADSNTDLMVAEAVQAAATTIEERFEISEEAAEDMGKTFLKMLNRGIPPIQIIDTMRKNVRPRTLLEAFARTKMLNGQQWFSIQKRLGLHSKQMVDMHGQPVHPSYAEGDISEDVQAYFRGGRSSAEEIMVLLERLHGRTPSDAQVSEALRGGPLTEIEIAKAVTRHGRAYVPPQSVFDVSKIPANIPDWLKEWFAKAKTRFAEGTVPRTWSLNMVENRGLAMLSVAFSGLGLTAAAQRIAARADLVTVSPFGAFVNAMAGPEQLQLLAPQVSASTYETLRGALQSGDNLFGVARERFGVPESANINFLIGARQNPVAAFADWLKSSSLQPELVAGVGVTAASAVLPHESVLAVQSALTGFPSTAFEVPHSLTSIAEGILRTGDAIHRIDLATQNTPVFNTMTHLPTQ